MSDAQNKEHTPQPVGGISEKDARLADVRTRIDAIDTQLLTLLNERSTLSLEVGRIKAGEHGPVFKPQRENAILDHLAAINTGPLPEKHLRIIWREIFSSSRSLQVPTRVAYLGPEGTFSYFAGLGYFGRSAIYNPCRNFFQIFEEVNAGGCDVGVVPLENSLQGTVGACFDLFLKYPVTIRGELYSRISHCLLSVEHSLSDIKTVYSHPQPLGQCQEWLRANLPQASLVPLDSSAAAAHRACSEPGSAAIGNGNLAEMLDLTILARRIEDEPGNWTRFVIITPEQSDTASPADMQDDTCKTSALFTLADRPGALSLVLNTLAKHKVNMRKLESRPLQGERWKYAFFVDLEQNLLNDNYKALLSELSTLCTTFRILGVYPMGPQLDRVWSPDETREASWA